MAKRAPTTSRKGKTLRKTSRKLPKRILNCEPSKDQENDWHYEAGVDAGLLKPPPEIPAEADAVSLNLSSSLDVDLRANWWPVGNQLATGSCVGWASEALLRYHLDKAGYPRPKKPEATAFSVRQLWMAAKETDAFDASATTFIETAGTSLKASLNVIRKTGVVPKATLPFSGSLYGGPEQAFYMEAAKHRALFYVGLGSSNIFTLGKWLRWLRDVGPIMTRLVVDKGFDYVGSNGNIDAYDSYPPGHPRRGGHAVCVVGFVNNRFVIRNSWGTGWGDKGFGYASLPYAFHGNAFTEAYGIVGPLYNP